MIQVFINECSFHEQLHERSVLVDSFKQFYTLLSLFNQYNGRFRATTYIKKGRRVYLEQTTENYWYVDSLHYGPSAHLEIFDHTGNHIGEAALDGTFIGKKDTTKRLDL